MCEKNDIFGYKHETRHTNPFGYGEHNEAETKWQPLCKQHFQVHFLKRKLLFFLSKFHWKLFLGAKWQ